MSDFLSKFLKSDGVPASTLPPLKDLCTALTKPKEATPVAVAYLRAHPELVDQLREIGIGGEPQSDADECQFVL